MARIYQAPDAVEKDAFEQAIREESGLDLARAVVSAVFSIDDRAWLETTYLRLLSDEDPRIRDVRTTVATCLGHVATFFHEIDIRAVVPVLVTMLDDPRTRSQAWTALEDIAQVTGIDLPPSPFDVTDDAPA